MTQTTTQRRATLIGAVSVFLWGLLALFTHKSEDHEVAHDHVQGSKQL